MKDVVRVGQISDTHFLEPGHAPEGSFAYDTAGAFDAVLGHIERSDRFGGELDLFVVTGDIADHGRPEQYEIALDAFERLPAPVHLCPGNHDFDAPLRSASVDRDVYLPRTSQHGAWTFVYVDSNAGRMHLDDDGGLIDLAGDDRLHGNGSLGAFEAEWVRSAVSESDSEHVFVWVHHPPASDVPLSFDAAYTDEWTALIADLPAVRGFGAGHTHVPTTYTFADRPVYVAPSLKNNFDLTANTWLPPGYRTYGFHPDGRITADVHLVDDERWPRRPFGRAVRSLFMGEISFDDFERIVAERSR